MYPDYPNGQHPCYMFPMDPNYQTPMHPPMDPTYPYPYPYPYPYYYNVPHPIKGPITAPPKDSQRQMPEPPIPLKDYGPEPFVINIHRATLQNQNFRIALWTGEYLQATLMSINPREDIGLEFHKDLDQFIRIEEGHGIVKMGDSMDRVDFESRVHKDDAIFIPAGKWHNLINIGQTPLKLYSIYAPPDHPKGTVNPKKEASLPLK